LDWTPLAYLEGLLQIDRLHVAGVEMERLPQGSSRPGSAEASIPRIDVAEASFDMLHLGSQLAGTPASLVARGSAHLRSVRDMLFDGSPGRIDGDGEYELHLHFDEKRMDAALKLHEPAGGPLENIPVLTRPRRPTGCGEVEWPAFRRASRDLGFWRES